jgi:predicted acyl esterase
MTAPANKECFAEYTSDPARPVPFIGLGKKRWPEGESGALVCRLSGQGGRWMVAKKLEVATVPE